MLRWKAQNVRASSANIIMDTRSGPSPARSTSYVDYEDSIVDTVTGRRSRTSPPPSCHRERAAGPGQDLLNRDGESHRIMLEDECESSSATGRGPRQPGILDRYSVPPTAPRT
jgi:hypothetical protein